MSGERVRDTTPLAALRALRDSADQLATCGPQDQQRLIEQVLDDCEVADMVIRREEEKP